MEGSDRGCLSESSTTLRLDVGFFVSPETRFRLVKDGSQDLYVGARRWESRPTRCKHIHAARSNASRFLSNSAINSSRVKVRFPAQPYIARKQLKLHHDVMNRAARLLSSKQTSTASLIARHSRSSHRRQAKWLLGISSSSPSWSPFSSPKHLRR